MRNTHTHAHAPPLGAGVGCAVSTIEEVVCCDDAVRDVPTPPPLVVGAGEGGAVGEMDGVGATEGYRKNIELFLDL